MKRSTKPLKRTPLRRSRPKTSKEVTDRKHESEKMNVFFYYCTKNLENRSVVSGKFIPSPNKGNLHHVFPKSIHPEVKYSISNILMVTMDEHQEIERDPDCYKENVEKRVWVMDNWDACMQESDVWSEEYDKLKNKEAE
jgi:hypothetical protein